MKISQLSSWRSNQATGIALVAPTDNPQEVSLLGLSELTDPGFVIPDVLIPIVGMFAGVYALGVAIIGYQYGLVSRSERSLYSIVSVLLMVPALVLLFAEGVLGLAGVAVTLNTLTFDLLGSSARSCLSCSAPGTAGLPPQLPSTTGNRTTRPSSPRTAGLTDSGRVPAIDAPTRACRSARGRPAPGELIGSCVTLYRYGFAN